MNPFETMAEPAKYHDDLELRDRVLRGDRDAADRLFERHVDALYEFVHYRVGGDRGIAESIVQDTLLVAFQKLSDFAGRSTLHTWMCGIAKKKVMAFRRKRQPLALDDVLASADADIDFILAGIENEDIPDRILERRETRDLVGATLSSLPPDYRNALIQKYVEERSVAQIGASQGKGEKAAESTLTRARIAFARIFELLARKRGGME